MNANNSELIERLQKRADQIAGYIASSQRVVDLLQPEMDLFNARQGGHDTYTVRMAVDHMSSIRTQNKELADLTDAIAALRSPA